MVQNEIEVWEKIMNQIKELFDKEGKTEEFTLFFSGIKYIRTDGTAVILEVPSIFFQNQLIKRGYIKILEQKIIEMTNNKLVIEMRIPNLLMKEGEELYGRR